MRILPHLGPCRLSLDVEIELTAVILGRHILRDLAGTVPAVTDNARYTPRSGKRSSPPRHRRSTSSEMASPVFNHCIG